MNQTPVAPKHYDVVIVGAGMAGLSCAHELKGSNLNVLLIEKNVKFYAKTCAAGITPKDVTFIPRRYWHMNLQPISIQHRGQSVNVSLPEGVITTIDRHQYLQDRLAELTENQINNITVKIPVSLSRIGKDNTLTLSNGETITYTYLVGADGASSVVRKHLGLQSKDIGIAIQYIIPRKLPVFVLHLQDEITRYCWIFPYNNSTSIGCGSSIRKVTPNQLHEKLDHWLHNRDIDISDAKFEAALIGYIYHGYSFGNIFLAGDAAGITSSLSGKGIYPAIFMGRHIAKKILGRPTDDAEFRKIVLKKKIMELFARIADSSSDKLRILFFQFGMWFVKSQARQKILMRVVG